MWDHTHGTTTCLIHLIEVDIVYSWKLLCFHRLVRCKNENMFIHEQLFEFHINITLKAWLVHVTNILIFTKHNFQANNFICMLLLYDGTTCLKKDSNVPFSGWRKHSAGNQLWTLFWSPFLFQNIWWYSISVRPHIRPLKFQPTTSIDFCKDSHRVTLGHYFPGVIIEQINARKSLLIPFYSYGWERLSEYCCEMEVETTKMRTLWSLTLS